MTIEQNENQTTTEEQVAVETTPSEVVTDPTTTPSAEDIALPEDTEITPVETAPIVVENTDGLVIAEAELPPTDTAETATEPAAETESTETTLQSTILEDPPRLIEPETVAWDGAIISAPAAHDASLVPPMTAEEIAQATGEVAEVVETATDPAPLASTETEQPVDEETAAILALYAEEEAAKATNVVEEASTVVAEETTEAAVEAVETLPDPIQEASVEEATLPTSEQPAEANAEESQFKFTETDLSTASSGQEPVVLYTEKGPEETNVAIIPNELPEGGEALDEVFASEPAETEEATNGDTAPAPTEETAPESGDDTEESATSAPEESTEAPAEESVTSDNAEPVVTETSTPTIEEAKDEPVPAEEAAPPMETAATSEEPAEAEQPTEAAAEEATTSDATQETGSDVVAETPVEAVNESQTFSPEVFVEPATKISPEPAAEPIPSPTIPGYDPVQTLQEMTTSVPFEPMPAPVEVIPAVLITEQTSVAAEQPELVAAPEVETTIQTTTESLAVVENTVEPTQAAVEQVQQTIATIAETALDTLAAAVPAIAALTNNEGNDNTMANDPANTTTTATGAVVENTQPNTLTRFDAKVKQLNEEGSLLVKRLIQGLEAYAQGVKPMTPIHGDIGARHRYKLFNTIKAALKEAAEQDYNAFKEVWTLLLGFVDKHKDGVFHIKYVNRFAANWFWSKQELTKLEDITNLLTETVRHMDKGLPRHEVLKVVSLETAVGDYFGPKVNEYINTFYKR